MARYRMTNKTVKVQVYDNGWPVEVIERRIYENPIGTVSTPHYYGRRIYVKYYNSFYKLRYDPRDQIPYSIDGADWRW